MIRLLLLLAVLSGCPPKPASTTGPASANGPGCPAASGVYVASYVTQEKGRTGWVMPLHSMKVEPGAKTADYQTFDATTAMASGVPAAPTGTLWLMTAAGAPCRTQLGQYYAARLDGPPASLTYGIELEGCPAPTDAQEGGGIVLVAPEAPTGCRFEQPRPIAARLGQMTEDKHWQKPANETPVPPALGAAIPPHACTPPGCEPLWAVTQVDIDNHPVAWGGAFNWLAVGDPAKPCDWKAERYSGFWVPGADGKPVKVDEGLERPLVLVAVLADSGGAKALLAEGPGEYATYDLAPGKATLAHHHVWMLAPREALESVDHIGPVCEPPPAQAAPLPKDAKPVSPY